MTRFAWLAFLFAALTLAPAGPAAAEPIGTIPPGWRWPPGSAAEPVCQCPDCRAGGPKTHWGRYVTDPEEQYALLYAAAAGRAEVFVVGDRPLARLYQRPVLPAGFRGLADGAYSIYRQDGAVRLAARP